VGPPAQRESRRASARLTTRPARNSTVQPPCRTRRQRNVDSHDDPASCDRPWCWTCPPTRDIPVRRIVDPWRAHPDTTAYLEENAPDVAEAFHPPQALTDDRLYVTAVST
jgi:hypothetical protein